MTAGIQVEGDHGFLQIDEMFRNLVLRSSGSASSGTIVHTDAVCPVVVVKAELPDYAAVYSLSISGSTYTYTIGTGSDWWVFDAPLDPGGSGYGFQVFDGAGDLAFDARFEYMKIIGLEEFISPDDDSAATVFTVPSGKDVAVAFAITGHWTKKTPVGPGTSIDEVGGYSIGLDTGSGKFYRKQYGSSSASGTATAPFFFVDSHPILIFVDVTGL